MKKVCNDLFDYKDLKIYQDDNAFKFSLDSILLAEFVDIMLTTKNILDLCTGNAPVSLILSTKTDASIKGIELQSKIFDIAKESIAINNKSKQIEIINEDVNNVDKLFNSESFDIITCNPPYFKYNKNSLINESAEKAIARHEIKIDLETIVEKSSYLLKNSGSLYLVHRPERLEEIIKIMNKYKFSVKKLQFIYSGYDNNAIIVLVKAVKNGKEGLKVLKPINIADKSSYQNLVGE